MFGPCWGRVVLICFHALGVRGLSRGAPRGSELLERARVRDDGHAQRTAGTERDVQLVRCGERHVVLHPLPVRDSDTRYRAGDKRESDINTQAPPRIRTAPAIPGQLPVQTHLPQTATQNFQKARQFEKTSAFD